VGGLKRLKTTEVVAKSINLAGANNVEKFVGKEIHEGKLKGEKGLPKGEKGV